ncbi:type IV secretion protein IcmG, partial [Pseudomonas aeruginosa]
PAAANQYQQAPNYPSEPQLPATAAAPVPEVVLQPVSAVSPTAQLQQQAAVAPQAEAVAPVATSGQETESIAQVQKQLEQQDIQLKAIQETLDEIKKSLSTTVAKPAPKAIAASKPVTSQSATQKKQQQQAQRQVQKPQSGSGQQKKSPASISLKAVLDGRAWFVTKGGESFSVSVGD